MFSDEPPANAIFQIPLDFDEIDDLMRLIGLNDDDESLPIGNIRLTVSGGKRYWYTTDSYRLGRIAGLPIQTSWTFSFHPESSIELICSVLRRMTTSST